jgi:quercetin dioxygenase-like cupin family protein
MDSLSDVISLCVDRARSSESGRHAEHVVRSGPLQQTVVALQQGSGLAEHESDVPASLYIYTGAIRVDADPPFVLQSGALHVLPERRRAATAIQDTVMLLTAVTSPSGEGGLEDAFDEHILPTG